MKHIFGICYGALRQDDLLSRPWHDCKIVMDLFENNHDAFNHYWEVLHQKYPAEDGWFGHYLVCDWATSDQLKECLED